MFYSTDDIFRGRYHSPWRCSPLDRRMLRPDHGMCFQYTWHSSWVLVRYNVGQRTSHTSNRKVRCIRSSQRRPSQEDNHTQVRIRAHRSLHDKMRGHYTVHSGKDQVQCIRTRHRTSSRICRSSQSSQVHPSRPHIYTRC